MVIIVTYLAWELVSDFVPLVAQQQYIQPRVVAENLYSPGSPCAEAAQVYALGKGLVSSPQP